MNVKTLVAVGIQVVMMFSLAVSPMVLELTGTEVFLETQKMDPRALFRGDFVILGYLQAQDILPVEMLEGHAGGPLKVYVTFTAERPAQFVAVTLERPDLEDGQVCIVGRARWSGGAPSGAVRKISVDFPQIAQYFVSEGEGRIIEQERGENLLARVAVSSGCNAVLLGLEPR